MIVFVIDVNGMPLLPTHYARARKLLRAGTAKVHQVIPFTIQLTKEVENVVGEFEVGIDDGAKFVGIAVKNIHTNQIIFRGQLNHRQDVSRKVSSRSMFRKARRYRLRNRKPRFSNRIGNKLAPSIRQRKEAVVRVIKDLKKRLNIVKVIVEEVKFNHFKHHYGKFFSLVEVGKKYLKDQIQSLGLIYEPTFGYITKENRLKLKLSKSHSLDACAIVNSNNISGFEYQIKPRRTKTKIRKCSERNGFQHYDLVKANRGKRTGIIGSVRSLCVNYLSIRTKFDDNFGVTYNKTKLLQRFGGLVYSY